MGNLDGKTALVTGGSRGIGRAIVRRLAADGATVTFSFLTDEGAADRVTKEVSEAGGTAFAVQADQGSIADLRRLFGAAKEQLGGLDVVVCNAAVSEPLAIPDVTEDDFDRFMAVNAKGPLFVIKQACQELRSGGAIVSISSLDTVLHSPGAALYAGSKAALEQFTVVAALEFGDRDITANIVSPGATDTDLLRSANPGETFAEEVAQTALGRLGRPEDIASVVAFLAGPDSRWITGQNLRATGGFLP
jgi:3-oxoacyl-[acyl-carrier protein] reductase